MDLHGVKHRIYVTLTKHQSDLLFNGCFEFIAACGDMDKIGVGGCKFQFKLSRFIVNRAF